MRSQCSASTSRGFAWTRPYCDATPDSPDDAVMAELATHPVFRLTPKQR